MTFGALGGDPRSAHDVQAEKSRVGLPNTEEISAKSPEARNGCGETSRSAAYAKRPRASVPAVRGPPNRPVGPASSNTGIQKCGRSDGHMVYPVSEIGTAGAGSNRSGFARSEEHTSELQSPCNLVCRLLLEKKKKNISTLCMHAV